MTGIIAGGTGLLIVLLIILAPVIALLDIRKRELPGAWRVYWTLIIVLMPFFGALFYGLFAHRNLRD